MRRHWLFTGLLLLASLTVRAGELKIQDVFKQMPNSVLPTLSENNRLDRLNPTRTANKPTSAHAERPIEEV